MAENKLVVGEPRLCYLIHGSSDTPETVVMLQDTGDAITVTFPISGMASPQCRPHDRWWSPHIEFEDDPDRTKYSYSPPPVMIVYDDAGPVVLVGCHATGRARQTTIAGKGVLVVDFAILGGRTLNYDQINGMRTTSSAYRKWLSGSSINIETHSDDAGRLESLTMTLRRVDGENLSRKLNLSTHYDSTSTPTTDGYNIRESLTFQTSVAHPRKLREHLDIHLSILDLVSLAAWKNCTFKTIRVNRKDDPLTAPSGKGVHERWLEVLSHQSPGDDLTDCKARFLFFHGDMAPNGIDQWLGLREDYGRALDYLMRILRSGHTWSPQSAVMSGIALEQLGYLIEVQQNQGARLNDRGQLSFKDALEVILKDMDTLPLKEDEVEDWKERCRNVYMGAKHGDREETDHLTTLNTLRENLLVLRYWVAQRLGVSGEILDRNLPQDPLHSGFVSEELT
ncbi:HEPN domain-containing protein [Actinomyces marmotae]|uniref:ApeA N-terminal domain-containing protein n=1 Tax=Actinomyces marmotae TaxID=2737173 RepID=A0A6M8B681_9ACTO|nr:HEPN domain-containing protein [Actinomyces marmotae]QKD80090.1 hypothetical protein HPC72_07540 [Actinomyces marmotae]